MRAHLSGTNFLSSRGQRCPAPIIDSSPAHPAEQEASFMYQRKASGFTLIELLVVIAIIAILAAILFPVFAQAREKARGITCISNLKQLSTSTMMYVQDFDETFPMAFGYGSGYGGWTTGYTRPVPPDQFADAYVWAQSYSNAIQPYVKNYGVYTCPSSTVLNPGYTGITPAVKISYTYNGLLQSSPLAGINSPSGLIMLHSGRGAAYRLNGDLAQPVLNCATATDLTCTYKARSSSGCQSGNGSTSGYYASTGGMAVHGRGQNMSYSDGHAKFRNLSLSTITPLITDVNQDPWRSYTATGDIAAATSDGCHIWLFRPDFNFQ
jgi:prepilin-type N-terminal cleavage/methylation domain-containing protein